MTVEKTPVKRRSNGGRTTCERRSNDGTTRLMDRCDRVENAHASYHVDARVHVKPVFSGGVIICWRCSSQSNGTIQDYCLSVMAIQQSLKKAQEQSNGTIQGYCVSVMAIRQSLKKAQKQARNSKPLLHSASSEASICKIHPTQAMVVAGFSFPAPYSTLLRAPGSHASHC